jgi:hypothetical protein
VSIDLETFPKSNEEINPVFFLLSFVSTNLCTIPQDKNLSCPAHVDDMLSCTFQIASRKHQIDEQGWVDTILSVPINGTVRINTMDWLGQSQYSPTVVFWPVLLDAISKVQLLIFATISALAVVYFFKCF